MILNIIIWIKNYFLAIILGFFTALPNLFLFRYVGSKEPMLITENPEVFIIIVLGTFYFYYRFFVTNLDTIYKLFGRLAAMKRFILSGLFSCLMTLIIGDPYESAAEAFGLTSETGLNDLNSTADTTIFYMHFISVLIMAYIIFFTDKYNDGVTQKATQEKPNQNKQSSYVKEDDATEHTNGLKSYKKRPTTFGKKR